MTIQHRLNELEEEIARLRDEWRQATTHQDKAIIETRAKLLIWAKDRIKSYEEPQPDLYQTAKTIFSGGNDRPAKTSSAGSEYDSGPGEDTSG
jgi:hypothetical protein